jgi:hypothetical protein
MELQNRYYQNLEQMSKILEIDKDLLILQIKNLARRDGNMETDSHILQLKGIKPSQHGLLYFIHVLEKSSKRCVLNTPVLLLNPRRSRFVV